MTNFGHCVWSKFYWAWDFTHSCEWIAALLGQEFGFDFNPHERKLSIILSFISYLITLWWSWVHLGHLGILENSGVYLGQGQSKQWALKLVQHIWRVRGGATYMGSVPSTGGGLNSQRETNDKGQWEMEEDATQHNRCSRRSTCFLCMHNFVWKYCECIILTLNILKTLNLRNVWLTTLVTA